MNRNILQDIDTQTQSPRKGIYHMDNYLQTYIDNNIIREYLNHTPEGYSLDISELTEHDRSSLAQLLFETDPIAKEMIEDRMQQLIEDRLPWVESYDNYAKGLKPIHDPVNGEVRWV